jgi:hypothetical protein
MAKIMLLMLFVVLLSGCKTTNDGRTDYSGIYDCIIEPSDSDLFALAEYRIWIPPDAEVLRGVIVHQHGCGRDGMVIPYDYHWRALAKKWNCALMGTHYVAADSCSTWSNPGNGSERTFLTALHNFSLQSRHPELDKVPWILWGHSGGAFWVSRMLDLHPDRIIAVFPRSGGYMNQNPGAYKVPVMFNYGAKERKRVNGATYLPNGRKNGAYWSIAPDKTTGHNCGNSRLLAIPFFDACLAQRLPEKAGDDLKPMDDSRAWLGDTSFFEVYPVKEFPGEPVAGVWLPDENIARIWQEFVRTGWVTDQTPPVNAPYNLKAFRLGQTMVQITWSADADLESGIKQFQLYRNGEKIKDYIGINDDYVKKDFQFANYGDEPGPEALYENVDEWIPNQMSFFDYRLDPAKKYVYQVKMVNWSGLESELSDPLEVCLKEIH